MTTRAHIIRRSASLATDFGLSYATKLFGADVVAQLPLFSRGPRKGKIKAFLVWEKAESGGWSKYGVTRPGFVHALISATDMGEMPIYAKWQGHIQALSGHRDVFSPAWKTAQQEIGAWPVEESRL